jgi:hypothetical protein
MDPMRSCPAQERYREHGSSLSASFSVTRARISQHGEATFAVPYLPVPIVDFYVKAGVARISGDLSASVAGTACPPGVFCPEILTSGLRTANGAARTTATTFAAGAAVQWQIDNWAIRGEYARFTARGENPRLIMVVRPGRFRNTGGRARRPLKFPKRWRMDHGVCGSRSWARSGDRPYRAERVCHMNEADWLDAA